MAQLDPTMAVILKLSLRHAGHGSALPTQKHALRGWRAIQPPRRGGAKNITVGIFEAGREPIGGVGLMKVSGLHSSLILR